MYEHLSIPTEVNRYYNEIISNASALNWAVFGYAGEDSLKVVATGEDDISSMLEEFDDGKILYGFLRVLDENTRLYKFVFISWCPDGVSIKQKGAFNTHVQIVAKFLKGFHVQINARDEGDLREELIRKKVKDSSGAKYSIRVDEANPSLSAKNNASATITSAKPATTKPTFTPSIAAKTTSVPPPINATTTPKPINTNNSNSAAQNDVEKKVEHWNPFHKEVETAKPVVKNESKFSPSINWVQPTKSNSSVNISASTPSLTNSNPSLQNTKSEASSVSISKSNIAVNNSNVSLTSNPNISNESTASAARQFFMQKENSLTDIKSETNSNRSFNSINKSKSSISIAKSTESVKKSTEQISHEQPIKSEPAGKRIVVEKERSVKDLTKMVEQSLLGADTTIQPTETRQNVTSQDFNTTTPKQVEQVIEKQQKQVEHVNDKEESVDNIVVAIYDYKSTDPAELTILAGQKIRNVKRVDSEGWLYGETENGAGLFPESYVSSNPSETPQPAVEESITVVALYDYSAADENELDLVAGQEITNVTKEDADWWHGQINGRFGYFPAAYVSQQ